MSIFKRRKKEEKEKKYDYEKTEAGFIYTVEGVTFHYVKVPKTEKKAVEGSITKAGAGYETETVQDYDVYVTVSGGTGFTVMPYDVWAKKTEKDLERMENKVRQKVSDITGVSPERILVSGSVPLEDMRDFLKRSNMGIIYSILKSVESIEKKRTQILYKAGVSFITFDRYMDILIKRGLIEIVDKEGKTYLATEEGRDFIRKIEELKGAVKERQPQKEP